MKTAFRPRPLATILFAAGCLVPSFARCECCGGGGSGQTAPSSLSAGGGRAHYRINWTGPDDVAKIVLKTRPSTTDSGSPEPGSDGSQSASVPLSLKNGTHEYDIQIKGAGRGETYDMQLTNSTASAPFSFSGAAAGYAAIIDPPPKEKPQCPCLDGSDGVPQSPQPKSKPVINANHQSEPAQPSGSEAPTKVPAKSNIPGAFSAPTFDRGEFAHDEALAGGAAPEYGGLEFPTLIFRADLGQNAAALAGFGITGELEEPSANSGALNASAFFGRGGWVDAAQASVFTSQLSVVSNVVVKKFLAPSGLAVVTQLVPETKVKIDFYKTNSFTVQTNPLKTTTIERVAGGPPIPTTGSLYEGEYASVAYGWKVTTTMPAASGIPTTVATHWFTGSQSTTATATDPGRPTVVSNATVEDFGGSKTRVTEQIVTRVAGATPAQRTVTTKQWIVDTTTQLLYRDQETLKTFPWGESVVSRTLEASAISRPGGPAQTQPARNLTTVWEYWEAADLSADKTGYSQPKFQLNWDGSWWVRLIQSANGSTTTTTITPWKNSEPPASRTYGALTGLVSTPSGTIQKEVSIDNGDDNTTTHFGIVGAAWTEISKSVSHTPVSLTDSDTTDTYASATERSHTYSTRQAGHPGTASTTSQYAVGAGAPADVSRRENHTRTAAPATGALSHLGFIPSVHYDPDHTGLRISETSSYDDTALQTHVLVNQTATWAATGLPFMTRRLLDKHDGLAPTTLEEKKYTYDSRNRPTSVEMNSSSGNLFTIESWSYPDEYTVAHTGEDGVTRVTGRDVFGRVTVERIVGFAGMAPLPTNSAGVPAQPDVVTWYAYTGRTSSTGIPCGWLVTSSVKALNGSVVVQQRTLSVDEYDGTGALVRHTDSITGRSDSFVTYPAGATVNGAVVPAKAEETRLGSATGPLVAARTYFQDGRVASDVRVVNIGQTPVVPVGKYYDYFVQGAYLVADSVSSTAPATAGGPLAASLSTTTVRDGLGRVESITQPSATFDAAGAATASTEKLVYKYDGLGRLSARQLPGTGSGVAYEVFKYDFDAATQASIVETGRRTSFTPAGANPDANRSRVKTRLFNDGSQWWHEEATDVFTSQGWAAASTRRSLAGEIPTPSSGALLESSVLVITGGTETRLDRFIQPAAQFAETSKTVNGILTEGTQYYNGLPCVYASPLFTDVVLSFTPLREPEAEPSFANYYWPRLAYDVPSGRVSTRLLPNGGAATESYVYYPGTADDPRAGLLKSKAALTSPGGVTYYDYNGLGQLTAQWGTGDYPVRYVYDAQGRLQTMATYQTGSYTAAASPPVSGGNLTTWAYASNALSWVVSKADHAGKAVHYTYHPGGVLATRTWARNIADTSTRLKTTYTYDVYGRQQVIDYADSTPDVTFTYDAAGRVYGRYDGSGSHFFEWRADGQLEKEYVDDRLCNLLVLDPRYDAFGRRDQLSVSWGAAAQAVPVNYEYSGNLLSKVTSGSPASREVHFQYSTSVTPASFEYWLTGLASAQLTRTQSTDANGRIGSITYTSPNPPGQTGSVILASLNYGYDGNRVTDATRENNNQWHYEYDASSQVAKARKRFAANSDAEILAGTQAEYAYDLIGNRTSWKWGGSKTNGDVPRTVSYTPDNLNRYTTITNAAQSYDVTGRRTGTNSVTVTQSGTSTTLAAADFQSGASGSYFGKQLIHDPAKGLYDSVSVTTAGIPTDAGTQYIPAVSITPSYDDDGNLLTDGRWTYTWDAENRLVKMECAPQAASTSTGAIAVPGYRLTFYYDGLSRRVAKRTEFTTPGSSTWAPVDFLGFAYDDWDVVMSVRLDPSFNPADPYATSTVIGRMASYVWGPDIGSSGYARSGWQKAGGVGGLLMVLDGVSTPTTIGETSPPDPADDDYFPLYDRLGNIIGYRKAAVSTTTVDYNNLGATGALYDYDAFGRELRSSGPAADLVPFHFSTKFTDQETGLNYYGYRYYDPQNGRWLNRDPIGERGGENLYEIVENNTLSNIDLLGLTQGPQYPEHLLPLSCGRLKVKITTEHGIDKKYRQPVVMAHIAASFVDREPPCCKNGKVTILQTVEHDSDPGHAGETFPHVDGEMPGSGFADDPTISDGNLFFVKPKGWAKPKSITVLFKLRVLCNFKCPGDAVKLLGTMNWGFTSQLEIDSNNKPYGKPILPDPIIQ